MKIIKILLLILVLLVAGVLAYGFMSSGDFKIERSIEINAKPEAIYPMVDDLKRWSEWATWYKEDSGLELSYGEKTKGVGAFMSWSDKSGKGELTVTKSDPKSGFAYDMAFIMGEGKEAVRHPSTGRLDMTPNGDKTKVTWVMEGKADGIMMKLMFGLMGDMSVGNDFQEGLENMKALAEKKK